MNGVRTRCSNVDIHLPTQWAIDIVGALEASLLGERSQPFKKWTAVEVSLEGKAAKLANILQDPRGSETAGARIRRFQRNVRVPRGP